MSSLTLIIGRQVFEVRVSSEEQAVYIQDRISDLSKEKLSTAMAEVIDGRADIPGHVRLDRVTIDLGRVSKAEFEQRLLEAVKNKLEELLRKEASALPAADRPELEALRFFLQQGRFPWWLPSGGSDVLERLLEDLYAHNPSGLKRTLQQFRSDERIRTRILAQFPTVHLQRIVSLLWPGTLNRHGAFLDDLLDRFRTGAASAEQTERRFRRSLIDYLWRSNGRFSPSKFERELSRPAATAESETLLRRFEDFLKRGDEEARQILLAILPQSIPRSILDRLSLDDLRSLLGLYRPDVRPELETQYREWMEVLQALEPRQLPVALAERRFLYLSLDQKATPRLVARSFLDYLASEWGAHPADMREWVLAVRSAGKGRLSTWLREPTGVDEGAADLLRFLRTGLFQPSARYPHQLDLEVDLREKLQGKSGRLAAQIRPLWLATGLHPRALTALPADLLPRLGKLLWESTWQQVLELKSAMRSVAGPTAGLDRLVDEQALRLGRARGSASERLTALLQQVLAAVAETSPRTLDDLFARLGSGLPTHWKAPLDQIDLQQLPRSRKGAEAPWQLLSEFLQTGAFRSRPPFRRFSDLVRRLRDLLAEEPEQLRERLRPAWTEGRLSPRALRQLPLEVLRQLGGLLTGRQDEFVQRPRKRFSAPEPGATGTSPGREGLLEMFRSFLRHGVWSEEGEDDFFSRLDRALLWLAERRDPGLKALLRSEQHSVARQDQYLSRLSLETQDAIMELLAGEEWGRLESLLRDLRIVHWDLPWTTDPVRLEQRVNQVILRFLLQRYELAVDVLVEELISELTEIAGRSSEEVWSVYQATVGELREEGLLESELPAFLLLTRPVVPPENGPDDREAIADFLRLGSVSAVRPDWSAREVENALLALIDARPRAARDLLRELGREPVAIQRLIDHFGRTTLDRIIAWLSQGALPELQALVGDLDRLEKHSQAGRTDMADLLRTQLLSALLTRSFLKIDLREEMRKLLGEVAAREEQALPQLLTELAGYAEAEDYSYLLRESLAILERSLSTSELTAIGEYLEAKSEEAWKRSELSRTLQSLADRLAVSSAEREPPFWIGPVGDAVDSVIREVERPGSDEFAAAWRTFWPQLRSREALVRAMSEKQTAALLQALAGAYGDFGNTYLEVVAGIDGGSDAELEVAARLELLAYLSRRPEVASEELVGELTRDLAARRGLDAADLLARLREEADRRASAGELRFFRLREILQELEPDSIPIAEAVGRTKEEEPEQPAPPEQYADRLRLQLEALQYFLQYGAFRPEHPALTAAEWEKRQRQWIDRHPGLMAELYRNSLAVEAAAERLLRFFSESTVMEVIALLAPGQLEGLTYLWGDLNALLRGLGRKDGSPAGTPFFYRQTLRYLGAHPSRTFDFQSYLEELLRSLAKRESLAFESMFAGLLEQIEAEKVVVSRFTRTVLEAQAVRLKNRRDLRRAMSPKGEDARRSPAEAPLEEVLYVPNAGLAIVAPFLSAYFQRLNLVEDGRFHDEPAARRAAMLLHYLSSGRPEGPEQDMSLNKILCGLPLFLPLPYSVELTEAEREVSESLLKSILQSWGKLKDATIATLQETFLWRPGRLSEEADRWELIVESRAYDILVEFIPWTISMIKLPWMEKRIEVTWKTKL